MSDLHLVVEGPLARIVLDRPARRNAMSAAMWRDLAQRCSEIEGLAEIDAVIVEGVGGHFCSGADIAEFDEVFADLDAARNYLSSIETALWALATLDRPSIANIEGSAVGGGLALALACDLRFAAEDAHLAIPPARLGLLYGPVETRLLVETIGAAAAKDLLFSGRRVETPEALRLGLINRRLAASELGEAVERQAREWTKLSRSSIRGAKKAVRAALGADVGELRALVEAAAMGEDFREGRAAFAAKRAPQFGRRG
jgi:enoyl-CoA hydratase/carnithine racemase